MFVASGSVADECSSFIQGSVKGALLPVLVAYLADLSFFVVDVSSNAMWFGVYGFHVVTLAPPWRFAGSAIRNTRFLAVHSCVF